jgi:hypothetical protein
LAVGLLTSSNHRFLSLNHWSDFRGPPQSAKKEWHAEKIMRLLHKVYPHAFPQCAIRTKTTTGWNVQANSKPNALKLDEFNRLYSECGRILHRGTIRTFEQNSHFKDQDYQAVLDWQEKIVDLMNEHFIGRAHGKGYYIVSLRTESG